MKILITGASGFIGSFIAEEALKRGFETWAAVRATSSRAYLQDPRIHFIELDLSSEEQMTKKLAGMRFDFVVHAAGVTKCLRADDFYKVNTQGTKNLVNAIIRTGMPLRRLVYMSSLSVFGAVREQMPYHDILETDTPAPNTAYGRSKLMAERFLDAVANKINYVVLRPTGVYGPREKDYFLMAKSIRQHVDFSVGSKPQDITFVYVRDVVQAVFLALVNGASGRKYFLSDGHVYRSATFSDELHEALGRPWWVRVKAPLALLRAVTFCGEYWGRLTGRMTVLNNDKYNILSQRNWRCDITPARRELGFNPKYGLHDGVVETVAWYKRNKWL